MLFQTCLAILLIPLGLVVGFLIQMPQNLTTVAVVIIFVIYVPFAALIASKITGVFNKEEKEFEVFKTPPKTYDSEIDNSLDVENQK